MKLPLDEVLAALPPESLPLIRALRKQANARDAALYLVGGPVRDLLLERPIRDVDLLFEPRGDLDAEALARATAGSRMQVEAYDRFGTVRLSAGGASVDVATARKEQYRHAGALPKVEPASLAEDLWRRDFSVNALALPLRASGGQVEVVDPCGGLADLEKRALRVLHEQSFHDDPTRALRAARLAPRLDFALSRRSRAALRGALRDGAFGAVSGERLRRELEKLFDDSRRGLDPSQALRLLDSWHVLPALEPGLGLPRDSVAPVRRLGRSLAEPPWRSPRLRPWCAGLATWLAPLPAGLRGRFLDRLKVRGDWRRRLAEFPAGPLRLVKTLGELRGRGAVDAALGGIGEEELFGVHAWANAPVRRRIVRWAAEDRLRRPPVSGSDLVGLGLEGPAVGEALAAVRLAFLDGAVANREEALAFAEEHSRSRKRAKRPRRRAPRKRKSP